MKRICCSINPFKLRQSIYIVDDKKIDLFEDVLLQDLSNHIFNLAYQYNVYDVQLEGIVHYTQKTKKEIKEKELLTYNVNKIFFIE